MADTTLSARLAHARKLAGLSTRALEEAAGLGSGHAWKIEAGEIGSIATPTASALASALGVPVAWLMLGEGAEPTVRSIKRARKVA